MDFLDQLIPFFAEHGYVAVFVVLLVSGFGVPIPEDISLVAGGIIAGLGYVDLRVMIAVSLAGVLIGDSTMFLIGRYLGDRALRLRWIGHVLTPRRYARVQQQFGRYGNRMMFIARFLPGLRAAVFLTAGMTRRVSFLRFLLLDGFAALISVPVWVALGYYGAENHDWLLAWIKRGQGGIALAALLIVAATVWFFWRRGGKRRERLRALREQRGVRAQRGAKSP